MQMDVLSCHLVQVGGATYRTYCGAIGSTPTELQHRPHPKAAAAPTPQHQQQQPSRQHGQQQPAAAAAAEADASSFGAVLPSGAFSERILLDPEVLPFLIGRQGTKRREVERETGATIDIPRRAAAPAAAAATTSKPPVTPPKSDIVVIKGPTQAAVDAARARIDAIFDHALNSPKKLLDYDSFVALPLRDPSAAARLAEWGRQVRAHPQAAEWGLTDESIFVSPAQLHLTLAMLKLYSDPRRHAAAGALRRAAEAAAEGGPLRVRLRGLANMGGDDSAMHVAYCQVEEVGGGGRLEAICSETIAAFKEAGLLIKGEREDVKVHATVINTRCRAGTGDLAAPSGSGGQQRQAGGRQHQQGEQAARLPFDGRGLLHGPLGASLDLGEIEISEVCVARRGAMAADGFYECLAREALLAS